MEIRYHKNFTKNFLKLSDKIQEKVERTIETFQSDPHHPLLHNHALHGKYQGLRAISAGGDMRLIFKVVENYEIVEFLMVGAHTQAY